MIERFFLNIVKNFDNMENYNIKNKIRGRKMDTNEKSNRKAMELLYRKNSRTKEILKCRYLYLLLQMYISFFLEA